MRDKEIIDLLNSRDETVIHEIEIKYESYIMSIAMNILGDFEDAKEVLNDTLYALWQSTADINLTTLKAYIGKISRRISIDLLRKKSSIKRKTSEYSLCLSEIEELLPGGTSPEEIVDYKTLYVTIQAFLSKLSTKDRDIFLGRYFYFDQLKDIAAYCKLDEKYVKSRLYRIRQKLKSYLKMEGYIL